MLPRLLDIAARRVHLVFGLFLVFVVGSLAALIAVDVYNVGGLREIIAGHRDVPFFWHHWYLIPFENPIQWTTLALVVVVFGANAVLTRRIADDRGAMMWTLLSIGAALMFLEDALDIRHRLRDGVLAVTGEHSYGVIATLVELGYFALLAAVLVYALVRFRRYIWENTSGRRYFIGGYLCYATAVASSWLGSAFRDLEPGGERDLYTLVGDRITRWLFSVDDETLALFAEASQRLEEQDIYPLAFAFMDRVWEESIETLGAAALLCAGLAFWSYYRRHSDTGKP